jgi:hypothetical protein
MLGTWIEPVMAQLMITDLGMVSPGAALPIGGVHYGLCARERDRSKSLFSFNF